jgi:hypothetical protein
MNKKVLLLSIICFYSFFSFAGNPDRQGEAGAYELLLNPWARTTGLHAMNTSFVRGAEAMSLNVAGLSRINKTEIGVAHSIYLQGTGLGVNGLGIAQRTGENGVFGISINALSFGSIPVTTNNLPEGTGASFTPLFFNLAVSYAHSFEKKVSVGATVRFINESLSDVSASGISIDAGVQYFTGAAEYPERFKIGISLRNIGAPMRFSGQGLNESSVLSTGAVLNLSKNSAQFELPSQLNIGAAYDILPEAKMRLTAVGNFTSNAFSRDELGGGLEFGYGNYFMVRGGYKYEVGTTSADVNRSVFTGVCGGISVEIPFNKSGEQKLSIDYSYLATNVFNGSHSLALRLNL